MPKGSERTRGEPSPAIVVTRACHATGVGAGFRVRLKTENPRAPATISSSITTSSDLRINGFVKVKLRLGEHLLDARDVAADVQAIDERVMHFHRKRHQGALVFANKLAERNLRHRVVAARVARVRETRESDPRQGGAMDAGVVVEPGIKTAVFFHLLKRALRGSDEFRERLGVIEVNERERFVRQHERGAAVDYVMNQDAAVSQAIAKLFDLVRGFEREVVIRQRDTRAFVPLQFVEQVRDVQPQTDIEKWLVEVAIELKHLAPRPRVEIDVSRHT